MSADSMVRTVTLRCLRLVSHCSRENLPQHFQTHYFQSNFTTTEHRDECSGRKVSTWFQPIGEKELHVFGSFPQRIHFPPPFRDQCPLFCPSFCPTNSGFQHCIYLKKVYIVKISTWQPSWQCSRAVIFKTSLPATLMVRDP